MFGIKKKNSIVNFLNLWWKISRYDCLKETFLNAQNINDMHNDNLSFVCVFRKEMIFPKREDGLFPKKEVLPH